MQVKVENYLDQSLLDIATALETQANVTLDRKNLQLSETIKEIGTYEATAQPHPDVEFSVTIEVVDSE